MPEISIDLIRNKKSLLDANVVKKNKNNFDPVRIPLQIQMQVNNDGINKRYRSVTSLADISCDVDARENYFCSDISRFVRFKAEELRN